MKDKKFLVKISDLLNETGRSDDISFDHKFVDQFPTVTEEGISGTLSLQGVDENSLLGTLQDIHCQIDETCDSCGAAYVRTVDMPEYIARFVTKGSLTPEEQEVAEEAILLINDKDNSIDIEEMITQAILLNDPFVKRCPKCEKKIAETEDEEDWGTFGSTGNIQFS
jgi:hypothetical protein